MKTRNRRLLMVTCLAVRLTAGPDAARAQEGLDSAAAPAPAAPRDPAAAALYERLLGMRSVAAVDSVARTLRNNELHSALVAARRHELSRDLGDAQRAFNLFYAVASRDSTAAWAFFGMGSVVAARPAVLFERPGLLDELLPPRRVAAVLGLEPASRAQQAMLRALLADPTIDHAALMIADMAVVSMDPMELEIAVRALTWVTERADAAPEVWLALSRVRGLMADVDAANAAALTALASGADPSLSLVSAAAALLTHSATENRGALAYLEGTRVLSEQGAARYFRDVSEILDPADQRAWRTMVMDERGAWLRRYWDVRAGLSGATVARALGIHYRMLSQADRYYGGEYGEPSPVDQLLGTGDRFPNMLRSSFVRPLDYVFDFYQFRGEADRTSVTVALGVPTDQLRPMLTDSQVVYGVSVSAILVDSIAQRVSRVDTTLYYAGVGLAESGSFLRSYVELEMESGDRAVYRLVVGDAFDPRTGELFGGPVRLRDFGSGEIQMSDVVLTRADAGTWRRGGLTFPLTPAQSFATTEAITVFYEVYNLPAETPYRTQIRVVPVTRGLMDRVADLVNPGTRSLTVTFESTTAATAGAVQEVRTLQTPLRPDDYLIEVTVIDLRNGDRASASSQMTLVESD